MEFANMLEHKDLLAVLQSAHVVFAKSLFDVPPALGLEVPQPLMQEVMRKSGIDRVRVLRQGYTAFVKVADTPALIANVNKRSLYGGTLVSVPPQQHYLRIINDVLWMQYQSICGQWRLADMDGMAFDTLDRALTQSICHQLDFVARFAPLAA